MTDGDYGQQPSAGGPPPPNHQPSTEYAPPTGHQPPSAHPQSSAHPQPGYQQPGGYQPGVRQQAGAYPSPPGYQQGPPAYPGAPGYSGPTGSPGAPGYQPNRFPPPVGYPAPPNRPPARRRWRLWVGLGTVAALLLCAAPVVVGVVVVDQIANSAAGTGAAAASPEPGDPPSVTADWLGERITGLLAEQAKALLGGDETGYLAAAEPGTEVARQLRREFRTLRAMKVTKWQPELRGMLTQLEEPGQWRASFTIQHCFVTPSCEPNEIVIGTRWRDAAEGPRLMAIDPPPAGAGDRPRPWETDELEASIGERTVVATPRAFRNRLPELLREAEQAAKIADRYAVDGSPPDRYLIFYAGPNEWKLWYGGDRPEWTAGFAVPVSFEQYDLVLNSKALRPGQYATLMRHELTHAASMAGAERTGPAAWWLVEGLAEIAAAGGAPANRYESLHAVKQLVSSGWDGKLDSVEPADRSEDWHVAGSYGIGYLAVRHLQDRFGEQRLLTFFKLVVHDGKTEEVAASEAFGVGWAALHDDCVEYVRKVAR